MQIEIPKVRIIYLDMDGVLVDDMDMFQRLCPTLGKSMKEHVDFLKIFGKKQDFIFPLISQAIDKNHFATAKPTLFLTAVRDILLPYWKSLGIEVEILTSTMSNNPKTEELRKQKLEWLNHNFLGDLPVNFTEGSAKKQEYAIQGSLLIDDYDRTIGQFIANGGYAIQYTNLTEVMYKLRLVGLAPPVVSL